MTLWVFVLGSTALLAGLLVNLWRRLQRSSDEAQTLNERVNKHEELPQALNEQVNRLNQLSRDLHALRERVENCEQPLPELQELRQQLPSELRGLKEQVDVLHPLSEEVRALTERGGGWNELRHEIQALADRVNRAEGRLAEIERVARRPPPPAAPPWPTFDETAAAGHAPGSNRPNGDGSLPSADESASRWEPGASGTSVQPQQPGIHDEDGPTRQPLDPERQESSLSEGGDLSWIQEFAEEIRQGRVQRETLGETHLDRWVEVASRAERAGEQTELGGGFALLMEQSRSLLGIDIVRPQIGSSVQDPSFEVVENGPLDGTVGKVVSVGLRTCDTVLRPARVKAEFR